MEYFVKLGIFFALVSAEPGELHFKFLADVEWLLDEAFPTLRDFDGNTNNAVIVPDTDGD